jgi:hypothetical protein
VLELALVLVLVLVLAWPEHRWGEPLDLGADGIDLQQYAPLL